MNDTAFYILLDQIKIADANAISGPLSYGFPSINGFLGAVHALERRLKKAHFPEIRFDGVLISCQEYSPKIDNSGYEATFIPKRAPLDKNAKTAGIVEEGYVNLTVSLIIKAFGNPIEFLNFESNKKTLQNQFKQFSLLHRFAGGTVESIQGVTFYRTDEENILKKRLLPGYVLIDATEDAANIYYEMIEGYRTEIEEEIDESTGEITNRALNPLGSNPTANTLDILLNTAIIHQIAPDEKDGTWQSYSFKSNRGWLVPIPIGYQAISPQYQPRALSNARNLSYPSQFVEAIYALGKWVFPHRLEGDIEQYFWRYTETVENLYLIKQS